MNGDKPPPGMYFTDASKLTFRECWRLAQHPLHRLILTFWKLRGKPINTGVEHYPSHILPVTFEDLPPQILPLVEPGVQEWKDLGFREVLCYTLTRPKREEEGKTEGYTVSLLDRSNTLLASVMAVRHLKLDFKRITSQCTSRMQDGTILVTTSSRKEFLQPPELKVVHLPGKRSRKILDHHEKRIRNCAAVPIPVEEIHLKDHVERNMNLWLEFMIDRGVLVLLSPEEELVS